MDDKALIRSGKKAPVARVNALVFDKTGTLTTGRPVVTRITPLNGASENQVLAAAAVAEKYSEHPLDGARFNLPKSPREPGCATHRVNRVFLASFCRARPVYAAEAPNWFTGRSAAE